MAGRFKLKTNSPASLDAGLFLFAAGGFTRSWARTHSHSLSRASVLTEGRQTR